MRKIIFSVLFLILLLFSACNGLGDDKENDESNEEVITPVETEEVQSGDFVVEKTIYGQISPIKQIPVILQQPGEIRTLKVENGDDVKKDDLLATIKTPLGNQSIYATNEGEIANLNVQEGGFQSNEEPLLMIVDLDKLKITFSVTPASREYFKKDGKLKVLIDEHEYKAKVLAIDTMPNETGLFQINAELDNEDRELLPGMTGKIAVADKKVKDTIIIPTESIMTESDESFVFVVKDDVAEKIVVEVVETQSDNSAIKANLKKGDQVIVNGQFTLAEGSKVEVVKEGK